MKFSAFCALLFVLTVDLAYADIYRCSDAGGTVIFSDNPLNLPTGCQADVVGELVSPEANDPGPSQPLEQSKTTQPPVKETAEQELSAEVEDPFTVLKGAAKNLADQFASTRRRVFRSTRANNRQTAMRELNEVRSKKGRLLSELDRSTLTRSQKREIEGVLASIEESE